MSNTTSTDQRPRLEPPPPAPRPPRPRAAIPLDPSESGFGVIQALRQMSAAADFPALDPARTASLWEPLLEIDAILPHIGFSPQERMTLSGHLFSGSHGLAFLTASAIHSGSQFFPGAEPIAASLQFRAERATAALQLKATLLRLAERAGDLALLDLSSASREAAQLCRAAEQDARSDRAVNQPPQIRANLLTSARKVLHTRSGKPGTVLIPYEPNLPPDQRFDPLRVGTAPLPSTLGVAELP